MTFVFVFYFPVQFSKSFPLFLQTARWLSHRLLPLSTSFFRNLFYNWFPNLSAHRKYSSLSLWLISCQSSPTACLIYITHSLLASTFFMHFWTCMHVYFEMTVIFRLIYHIILLACMFIFGKNIFLFSFTFADFYENQINRDWFSSVSMMHTSSFNIYCTFRFIIRTLLIYL